MNVRNNEKLFNHFMLKTVKTYEKKTKPKKCFYFSFI